MPYFPPADLPPPPLVQPVQMPTATAPELAQGLPTVVKTASRSPQKSEEAPTVDSPQARSGSLSTAIASDFADQAPRLPAQVPLPVSQVTPATVPETRAILLRPSPLTEQGATTNFQSSPSQSFRLSDPPSLEAAEPVYTLSAPWVSQVTEPVPAQNAEPGETVDPGSPPAANEATDTFPRGATPEPFWFNGGVVEGGVLLPPSQPTTRPPTPLNLTADYQEFEPATQVLEAQGDVVLRLSNGILSADQLWANLENRYVVVEGNVVFARGEQVIEADRGEYNLIQGEGSLFDARGELFLPRTGTDFGDVVPNDPTATPTVLEADPITNVRSTGDITFGTGLDASEAGAGAASPDAGGFVRRIRFEAEQLDFDAEGWYAEDIRLTNDPFSPPELEFRGDSARLVRLTEFEDELYVENARLVFDQSFTVPLLRDRLILRRGGPDEANPLFVTVGFDGEDRDGLFVERSFRVATSGQWEFFLTPQFLAQRFVSEEDEGFMSNFGLEADLSGVLSPRTFVEANASFSGLDLDNLDDRLRASVRVQQLIGTHSLNFEYSYRDRLYNGSLGFQNVQSSLGVVLLSPNFVLGDTGIVLSYQASAQYITAETDRLDLLGSPPPPFEDETSLGRFQGSVALSKGFLLWQGQPLPPTRDEGLRFTPIPRTPNIQLFLGGRGTYTYYTSDDTQERLSASIGVAGELGHFSKDFFDSTVFNLTYIRSFIGEGSSPFLFDRDVDQNVLSGGIIQQIYGPFRLGFQTAVNLDTGEVIDTDYILEYNRRTYGIYLRYSPTQSAGFIGFRLSEFDWSGRAPRFGGADIRQVEGGVIR